MKKIIFTADDFGLSKGVNLGIVEAFQNGPVRGAGLMANGLAFEHAVALAHEHPDLPTGVHLTLSAGKSIGGSYRTLTDAQGYFLSYNNFFEAVKAGIIDMAEVEAEYELQIHKILDCGLTPTYFDSHHHTHHLGGVFDVFLKMAERYQITKARMFYAQMLTDKSQEIKTTEYFLDGFYDKGVTLSHLQSIIQACPGASMEIMTHPAYLDIGLEEISSYSYQRIHELDILTGDDLREFLDNGDYQVCSFKDL